MKSSTPRAALLVLAALSMLLTGLFIATAERSDAQTDPCPAGFTLTADASNCFQPAGVSTSANGCPTGELTPDGTKCFLPARPAATDGATACPTGYSPDDSLNGACARFEAATRGPNTCPDGARGTPGACYILVARGSAGAPTCSAADAAAGGVVNGTTCVVPGPAPTNTAGTCPVSTTVFLVGGSCFSILTPASFTSTCAASYTAIGNACKFVNPTPFANPNPMTTPAHCPAIPAGLTLTAPTHTTGGVTKIESCTYTPVQTPATCTASADLGLVDGQCRRSVVLTGSGLQCTPAFTLVGTSCVRHAATSTLPGSCPVNAYEDAAGQCRRAIGDAPGPYRCPTGGTVTGSACVYTTGFTISGTASYFCDQGVRTVVADGTSVRAICVLGDPTSTTGPACTRGVLSTDNLFCLVPRIDSVPIVAPRPAFTG